MTLKIDYLALPKSQVRAVPAASEGEMLTVTQYHLRFTDRFASLLSPIRPTERAAADAVLDFQCLYLDVRQTLN